MWTIFVRYKYKKIVGVSVASPILQRKNLILFDSWLNLWNWNRQRIMLIENDSFFVYINSKAVHYALHIL